MLHIRMSDESREGKEHFKKLDMADYAKKSFGMFRGKETYVKMLVNNSLAGVIIDRFGKDVMMIPEDEEHFRVNVDVHVSKQFLGWVFSLGEAVKIIGPDEVVEQMRGEVRRLMEQCGKENIGKTNKARWDVNSFPGLILYLLKKKQGENIIPHQLNYTIHIKGNKTELQETKPDSDEHVFKAKGAQIMAKIFITLTGTKHYFGNDFLDI